MSNIELLRIVSMLLVMVGHADFRALGGPTYADISDDPVDAFVRFLVQSAAGVSVNVFILISGWFGITVRVRKLAALLFQVAFFGVVTALAVMWYRGSLCTPTECLSVVSLGGSYWFVKSYLLLFLFAPLLNMFAEKAPRRLLGRFLIAFLVFQCLFGWLTDTKWLDSGYSPVSFMGLYLIARYCRLYFDKTITGRGTQYRFLWVYLALAFLIAAVSMKIPSSLFYAYSSPLLILASLSFFLFFCSLSFNSKFVNTVAASCFAAYLVHAHPLFFDAVYIHFIRNWHESLPPSLFGLSALLWILVLFVCAIVLDKVRGFIWKQAERSYPLLRIRR